MGSDTILNGLRVIMEALGKSSAGSLLAKNAAARIFV